MTIHIDFETYSEAPINKCGAWAYAAHPSTEMICMAWYDGTGNPKITTDAAHAKRLIEGWIGAGEIIAAWNSAFEMYIAHHVLGVRDALDPEHWTDTAAAAAALALPRRLADCGTVVGLPEDKQKDKRGRLLIQRLCQPYRGKRNRDPGMLNELYDYCKQDTVAEYELSKRLRPLSANERKVWECDQRINARGLHIDIAAVEDAIAIIEQTTDKLNDEVKEITDGALENVSQRARVMDYIKELGFDLEGYDKAAINAALELPDLPSIARRLLEIRQQTGKTSTAKYAALKTITARDSRAHGLLMYHGASTGRWTGKLFQPQNIARGTLKDPDGCIELLHYRDSDIIDCYYGEPMEALSSCVRGMITAPEGRVLYVADYSAIEARVLAWLAEQQDVLDVFRTHGKLYEHAAAGIYRKAIDDVTKDERQIGKVASLALGYQGAAGAFQSMAANYGLQLPDEQVEHIVNDWRESNKAIVRYWYALDHAAIEAVRTGEKTGVGNVQFKVSSPFLYCRLPSGRLLAYCQPRIEEGKFGNDQVTYMGTNSYTRKWERQHIYGGKWAENVVQAVARDLMAEAMLRVESAGYEVVLSVHDELLAEADDGFGSVEEFEALMCKLPTWAKGLPLNAAGFEAKRYRKD